MESYPLGFFAFGIGLVAGVVIRRIWRLGSGSRELDRAVEDNRLSSDLRRRWDRQRIYFLMSILATLLVTGLMLYGIDQTLKR